MLIGKQIFVSKAHKLDFPLKFVGLGLAFNEQSLSSLGRINSSDRMNIHCVQSGILELILSYSLLPDCPTSEVKINRLLTDSLFGLVLPGR